MDINTQGRLKNVSKGLTAKRQVHRQVRQYSHGAASERKEKRELMEEDIAFVVSELKDKVASNWKELLQPETYSRFSARSCKTQKPGTAMFLSVFGGLQPWLERLEAEYNSECTFWKEDEVMAELAAAAKAAEEGIECTPVEDAAAKGSKCTDRAVSSWLATHKAYRDTEAGQEEQAKDCLARASAHRERQKVLADKQAEQEKEAEQQAQQEALEAIEKATAREEKEHVVEEIINKRVVDNQVEYRVRWRGYASKHNTWEPESTLQGAKSAVAAFEKRVKRKR